MKFKSIFKKPKIRVVFSHQYVSIPESEIGQTFDLQKYKRIRDKLVEQKLLKRKTILNPYMVSYKNMGLVHSEKYLSEIRNPQNVAQILNLGYANPLDTYILEFFRIVTGGTVLATLYALKYKTIVFNFGGGFHHARSDKGAGFCLINDVAIAIKKAKQLGYGEKFIIIDLDYHQGDGNLMIFKDDENVFTFSIHASHWEEIEKENNHDILVSSSCTGAEYMDILKRNLEDLCINFKPDGVIYIAGSDPFDKDSLCDMHLSRDEMFERNMYILRKIKALNIPLVVVAGGGYGPESWVIYYDFIKSALNEYGF